MNKENFWKNVEYGYAGCDNAAFDIERNKELLLREEKRGKRIVAVTFGLAVLCGSFLYTVFIFGIMPD